MNMNNVNVSLPDILQGGDNDEESESLESLQVENKQLKKKLLQIEDFVKFLVFERNNPVLRSSGASGASGSSVSSGRCDCRALDMLVSRFYGGDCKFPLPQNFNEATAWIEPSC